MKSNLSPDKKNAAICGLYCESCGVYIATQENNIEKLKYYASALNQPLENTYCDGCRSNRKTNYCNNCEMSKCASQKGVDFCGKCNEYPCETLKEFKSKMPHRNELFKSLQRINEVGWVQWSIESNNYFSCSNCNTLNSAYDVKCRNCGTFPGNEFVKNNIDSIKQFFNK